MSKLGEEAQLIHDGWVQACYALFAVMCVVVIVTGSLSCIVGYQLAQHVLCTGTK